MATRVVMPQLGESVIEGTVVAWLKKEGERVEKEEALVEITTDKVQTEIPSVAAGILLKILVGEGETVRAGTTLAWIGEPGETIPEGDAGLPQRHAHPAPATVPVLQSATEPSRDLGFISPVVARLAKEHQIDLAQIKGTGEGGRITKKDVLTYLESRKAAVSESPAWETPGGGELFRLPEEAQPQLPTLQPSVATPAPVAQGDMLIPHSTMRLAIAEHMARSKRTSPHVTTVMEADLSAVVAHREANKAQFARDGVRLTYTAYFISAIIAALKAYPQVNSSWSDEGVIVHRAIHIGMAVSLGEEGLIVPVIKNADGLSLLGLARAVNDLAERARSHHLQPDEVKGGTFSITNHGTSGSLFATPIIPQPQCGILGVGAIKKRPVVINDAIAIRPMVYLSFTFDHRILDGYGADSFLAKVVSVLENWTETG